MVHHTAAEFSVWALGSAPFRSGLEGLGATESCDVPSLKRSSIPSLKRQVRKAPWI